MTQPFGVRIRADALADFLGFELQQIPVAQRNPRVVLSLDRSNVSWAVIANQYVRRIRATCCSGLPLPLHSLAPAPLVLPDSFMAAPLPRREGD